jgi:hypothetical protein
MASFPKLTVNSLDALAVSVAVYQQFNNQVKQTESRYVILKHFTGECKLDITPEHIKLAEKVKSSIAHKIMMDSLMAVPNFGVKTGAEFINKINKLLNQETIVSRDFAFIAWAPNVAEKINKADSDKERMLGLGSTSQHIGRLNKKIDLTYHEVFCRYLPSYNSFIHCGHNDEGNLITFFSKSKIADGSQITAKVKSHKVDAKLANSKVTTLSYVRVKQ